MTQENRREAGTRLCRQLSVRIGRKVTPGLGRWEPAWPFVAGPSNAFMDALARWEETGTDSDLAALDGAYRALAIAWIEAERQFLVVGQEGVPA